MTDMVLDVQTLSKTLITKISTDKVMLREENGSIILTPVNEEKQNFDILFGMFSDGRLSTEDYIREKRIEMDMEE